MLLAVAAATAECRLGPPNQTDAEFDDKLKSNIDDIGCEAVDPG